MTCCPFSSGIATVDTSVDDDCTTTIRFQNVSVTNLAVAANLHACIVQHMTILTTAEYRTFHPCRTVDDD